MTDLCNYSKAETNARQQVDTAKGEAVTAITENISVDDVERKMLAMPQADCPVVHRFGPGLYVRELTLPAGTLAIGHAQKFEHLNIVIAGKVAMIDGDRVKIVHGPCVFTGQPGRKIGYVIETCVWQNVYATGETDIDKLEAMYLDKSDAWQEAQEAVTDAQLISRQNDRDDFAATIAAAGFDAGTVRAQSENEADQVDMPQEFSGVVTVRPSPIDGMGLFASWPISAGDVICPARMDGMRTQAGRYTNHAKTPNAKFVMRECGNIDLVAISDIGGCKGGDRGEEITVHYGRALALSGIDVKGIAA